MSDDDYDYALEYFHEQARNTGYAIVNMYKYTVSLIENKITDYIVNNISKYFFAEEAVDCMNTFANNVRNMSDDIAEVFVDLRNQLQSVVNNYEWQRDADRHLTVAYIQYLSININTGRVKPTDSSGNRYIKNGLSIDVEDWIHQCKNDIKNGVRNYSYNVPTDLYIGGGQSYAVRYALNQVAGIIDTMFGFLTYGENSIYNKIADYNVEYKKTGEDVANAKYD